MVEKKQTKSKSAKAGSKSKRSLNSSTSESAGAKKEVLPTAAGSEQEGTLKKKAEKSLPKRRPQEDITLKKGRFGETTWTRVADHARAWILIDASQAPLGRVATRVASILMGKHKPLYNPSTANGDFVIVINASGLRLTGKKFSDKLYHHHTGYIGGLKSITAKAQLEKDPCKIIQAAVKGMLPKTILGNLMFTRLKVYAGAEHPHQAQSPTLVAIES